MSANEAASQRAEVGHEVLVVDSREAVQRGATDAMNRLGIESRACGTLGEARQHLEAGRVGLLVLHEVLTDGSGVEFLRTLRASPASASTPVIMLSASGDVCAEIDALDAGADDCCAGDPCDSSALVARVQDLLRLSRALVSTPVVLLVEDSRTSIQVLTSVVQRGQLEALVARSGEEALELLATTAVDCVLLDRGLPGISGAETCRRIKASEALQGVPVLMLTAAADYDEMLEGYVAGADDYLLKGGRFEILMQRIGAHLQRRARWLADQRAMSALRKLERAQRLARTT